MSRSGRCACGRKTRIEDVTEYCEACKVCYGCHRALSEGEHYGQECYTCGIRYCQKCLTPFHQVGLCQKCHDTKYFQCTTCHRECRIWNSCSRCHRNICWNDEKERPLWHKCTVSDEVICPNCLPVSCCGVWCERCMSCLQRHCKGCKRLMCTTCVKKCPVYRHDWNDSWCNECYPQHTSQCPLCEKKVPCKDRHICRECRDIVCTDCSVSTCMRCGDITIVCQKCLPKYTCTCGRLLCTLGHDRVYDRRCKLCKSSTHLTKHTIQCELPGCSRLCRFNLCCTHESELENYHRCFVCSKYMCSSHIYTCPRCQVQICMHHRHKECPDWRGLIADRMTNIGNRYMVRLIQEYM